MNEKDIELLVAQILAEMSGKKSDCACGGNGSCGDDCSCDKDVTSNVKVAMLTGEKKIEVKEFPMPVIGDDEILVKVEGCGVCGTDVHEWKGDPFGLIPVVLGHEGSGEVVAMGKNVKVDTSGTPIGVGDKIVTSALSCGTCAMCLNHPELPQLCENQGVYGLIADSADKHLNGWFANYMVIRKGSTYFNVNGMSLDQRMLIELCAVAVHAVERAQKTNIMNFGSNILVQGCGPVGQVVIAVLKTYGYRNIFALDGNDQRLEVARSMGATETINFKDINTLEARMNFVNARTKQLGVDFAFQCTGVPAAAAEVYKYIRRGGGLVEMGFFVDNGDAKINPHHDLCKKEITLVGSWTYLPTEYPVTIAFMKRAKEIGIQLETLITHKYGLNELNEAMETNVAQKGIKIAYVNKDI